MVHTTIAGGVGTGFSRRCGIPQGCPFSMMLTALLMRPCVLLAKRIVACPRILADDILLLVPGQGLIRTFSKGLSLTHDYLIDMGAKIAEGKSLNFASTVAARKWLSATAWGKAGGAIKVVEHLRYRSPHHHSQETPQHSRARGDSGGTHGWTCRTTASCKTRKSCHHQSQSDVNGAIWH